MTKIDGENKGLILVLTGDGKGKTTSALGTVLRASGHGLACCVIQFIKSRTDTGEHLFAAQLPTVEFHTMGKGFVTAKSDREVHKASALAALAKAREVIAEGWVSLLVLDEITYALNLKFLDSAEVVALLKGRPPHLHVILTGRACPPEILAIADLVSEIKNVRHPFDHGIAAQKGIDY